MLKKFLVHIFIMIIEKLGYICRMNFQEIIPQ